ncbi:MAG: hypothetical protein LCH56_07745 [Proteobacteria bacterium]|nr:hypothetical protein [Pseudomonadota bacterium]
MQPIATWDNLSTDKLYAGDLLSNAPQYHTHIGLTLNQANPRNIAHDLTRPMPIEAGRIAVYQAEDVFEHIYYEAIGPIFADIHRVLKPGGLFRLSVPDYRCDILRNRSVFNESGDIVFDPGGGGKFENGRVIDGGHVWFPSYETVRALFDRSPFATNGSVRMLHYIQTDGVSVMNPIDYSLGFVKRTPDHDARVANPRRVMSIVVDAWKT